MKDTICKAVNFKDYKNTKPHLLMEMIFEDLLTLLKFIHKAQKEKSLSRPFFFTNNIDYLDSFWHHFILHSKMYHEFCMHEFGEYLHHHPEPVGQIFNQDSDSIEKMLIHQMNLIERELGRDFTDRIFFIYPELLN